MSDVFTTRCPKCGFASENPDSCDSCGALFSKVRAREAASEVLESGAMDPEFQTEVDFRSTRGVSLWLKVLAVLAAAAAVGYFGWQNFLAKTPPPTVENLLNRHRALVTRARRVLAQELESGNSVSEHRRLYNRALNLSGDLAALPKPTQPGNPSEIARRAALAEANLTLVDLLEKPVTDFEKLIVERQGADPFMDVERKLMIVENPENAGQHGDTMLNAIRLIENQSIRAKRLMDQQQSKVQATGGSPENPATRKSR